MRFLAAVLGFALGSIGFVALATFSPLGRTHGIFFKSDGTISPTADTRDRAIIGFNDPDGRALVVTFKDTSRALIVVDEATGATVATTTTTTTTTTTLATTTTTTTSTTTTT